MKRPNFIIFLLVLSIFLFAFCLYPHMPPMIVSHWDYEGRPDGRLPKFWGVFLMPMITLLLWGLWILIPKIDPLERNIQKFRTYFDNLIVILIIFLFYLYGLVIFWNFGYRFDFNRWIVPAFAALFYYLGISLEKAKRNWFVGIRTPWTLSNDRIWDKTHRLGGKLYKFSAGITLVGLLFPRYSFWFIFTPVLAASAGAIIYSYFQSRMNK